MGVGVASSPSMGEMLLRVVISEVGGRVVRVSAPPIVRCGTRCCQVTVPPSEAPMRIGVGVARRIKVIVPPSVVPSRVRMGVARRIRVGAPPRPSPSVAVHLACW